MSSLHFQGVLIYGGVITEWFSTLGGGETLHEQET